MDLNHMLIWTVGAGCVISLLQLVGRKGSSRIIATILAVLAILLFGLWGFPESAGYLSGVLFFIVLLIPSWGGVLLHHLMGQRRFRSACLVAQVMKWLRPTAEGRHLPNLIHAMALMKSGGSDERTTAHLLSLMDNGAPVGDLARVLYTRHQWAWQEFLDWANLQVPRHRIFSDPNLADTYLQALGETGQRDELLLRGIEVARTSHFGEMEMNLLRMKAAAFCGDEFVVAQFLSGSLRVLPDELKRFWRATAVHVAGRVEEAKEDFQQLSRSSDAGIARAAQRRLNQPLETLNDHPLTPEQVQHVAMLSQIAESQLQHGMIELDGRRCWATWTIALALVVVFLFEIPGGSEDPINLLRMGALLIPPAADGSDWWRMIAAAFLHFGPIHLVMNLLGLLILGLRLERIWGSGLLLVTYLVSAVGSIAFASLLIEDDNMLVGASGGVMGLLGGLLVQALFDMIRHRSQPHARYFLTLLAIVLIQMSFDINTPEVSSEAHLLGMVIGFCCGLLWNTVWAVQGLRRRSARG